MTVPELIDRLGGQSGLARSLKERGVSIYGPSTVSEWKRSANIPVRHWPMIIEVAAEVGFPLTAEDLMKISVAPSP